MTFTTFTPQEDPLQCALGALADIAYADDMTYVLARRKAKRIYEELSATERLPSMQWPKDKAAERAEDMGTGTLRIVLDSDNDVSVAVLTDRGSRSVEFCNPGGGGGGRSPETRKALIALMVAIEADNGAAPIAR